MRIAIVSLLTLSSIGFMGACSSDEQPQKSANQLANGTCGNGVVESGEACDGAELDGETCSSVTVGARTMGTLKCSSQCTFDTTGCVGASSGGTGGVAGSGGTGGVAGSGGTGGVTTDGGVDSGCIMPSAPKKKPKKK
jgi:hypothetical protein